MRKNPFRGFGIALVTPFKANGEVDFTALKNIVGMQLRGGADFLCVLGTTAETPCLTADEKRRIVATVREATQDKVPLLLGAGGNCTADVTAALKQLPAEGIDGVLVVTPYYNKPTQEGLFQHYQAVSAASPVPVVLYNVPGRTGVNLQAETTLRLAEACENMVAVKEASGLIGQIEEIIDGAPEGFEVLSGDDGITFELLGLGAKGVISVLGNAYPSEFGCMVHACLDGDYNSALEAQRLFRPLYKLLFVDGNPAGVKALLHLKQMAENVLRLPLVPATAVTQERLKAFHQKMQG